MHRLIDLWDTKLEVIDMRKDDHKKNNSSNHKQRKTKNAVSSDFDEQQNQSHNVKKEALGPNTRR